MKTGLERRARRSYALAGVGRTGAALAFTAVALLSGCAQFPVPVQGTPAEATPTGASGRVTAAPTPPITAPATTAVTEPITPPEPSSAPPSASVIAPNPNPTPTPTPTPTLAPVPAVGFSAPAVIPGTIVAPSPGPSIGPPPALGIGAPPGIGIVPPQGTVAAPPPAADVPFVIAFDAGVYKCELGRSVHVREITTDRRTITLQWSRKEYTLAAVEARTGALRFEDAASGFVWIVIPAKAMLLDARSGRQLANECRL